MLLGREVHVERRGQSHEADGAGSGHSEIDVRTPLSDWKDITVALRGSHQASNAALALGAIDLLRLQGVAIPDAAVRRGLSSTTWPARVEVIGTRPTVVIDAAHNWESAKALVATLTDDFRSHHRFLIFAATRDKDVAGLLRLLLPAFDTIILTRYRDNPRGVPVAELQSMIHSVSNREVHTTESPLDAWQLARQWASPDDLIAITGSFFLVAELRETVLRECALIDAPGANATSQ
jgi:dihydrofolate synthase/folylpolyglutamate synthase